MNNILKRIVSLFSVKEPQRDVPPAERDETPDQSPTMDHPKPVAVVVSPPVFDLDSYESFDEDYFRRTVDEILSDQASFENSFDEYHGAKMMDGTCDRGTSMMGCSAPGSSGSKASPYFPSKVARKRPVAHRVIRKVESTDEDDSEEDEETLILEQAEGVHDGKGGGKVVEREGPADSVAKIKLEELEKRGLGGDGVRLPKDEVGPAARAPSVIDVDACDDEDLEELSEERFVFASVSEEEHNRLVKFLLDHPFMREGAYPVKRSARRSFVSDVRREASISGMDEGALGVLIKWIKKTYLEVCMVADADKEVSAFGDEIDDEKMVEHRSPRELKKERKRKRTSIDQARGKTKTKKTNRSDISMVPSKHDIREVINVDSDDSAIAISKSLSANIHVKEKDPAPQTDLQHTPTSHRVNHGNVQAGRPVLEHVTPITPTTPSIQKRNKQSISRKKSSPPMPRHYNSTPNHDVKSNEGNLRVSQERISRNDSSKKRSVSDDADPPSSYSKNPKSPSNLKNIAGSREKKHEKNDKKRHLRKEIIRTRGGVALPVLFKVFERYPTVEAMATANRWMSHPPKKDERYRKLHYPCKLDGRDVRPQECIDDADPRVAWEVAHLPGVGAYSLDSWRIFCRDELRGLAKDWKGSGAATADFVPEWKTVLPHDKELRAYLTWMWLKEGWVWDRQTGHKTRASEKMMRAARRGGVALEENGNWILETSPVKKAANGLTTWD
ncbi:hypothetical protein BDV37DRAFT_271591 [Aspergillus pseudonomiae]|uniref:Pre-mRNA splicing factor n=1 Tax=Aspergillus pseudonomiae TaxID=1506151 RepID=A0A5N7DCH0_9EURO|nr:uncharacterized protein BDV37DRAFT_271591 [Aspergillus pseudonomiae]KAE8404057.1 hypothetical protein BDV37DRAFT_271591 [Aspergillus pseudonomiae]